MRTSIYIKIENPHDIKSKMLSWAQQFREVVFLDSNFYPQGYSSFDFLLAVDSFTSLKTDYLNAFNDIRQYQIQTKDWLFGYFTYDLKNDIEELSSDNFDGLGFPDLYFFQPKKIFILREDELEISFLKLCEEEINSDWQEILNFEHKTDTKESVLNIQQRISKEDYINKVELMLNQIQKGNIYEANFCMEFFSENAEINPLVVYNNLNEISQTPFAAFLKMGDKFLMSASPERYLRKEKNKIISQPIKGTSKRSADQFQDERIKKDLAENPKERSENIMIVDLVRNDLSQTASKGSVKVEELCGIYTFKQVHQMISTVVSEIKDEITPIDVIKTTFPMGSMTGAPKISAMKIIEELEETKRGLYSGAVGYITPDGDFDFNVVIRSILYNSKNKYLSFSVGSAITSKSIPEMEYEECLLKGKAMFQVLK